MPFDKKAWQRRYMREYMRRLREAVKTNVKTTVESPNKSPNKSPNIPHVGPDTYYLNQQLNSQQEDTRDATLKPTITTTHHFVIRARRSKPGDVRKIAGVEQRVKGGGRINYGMKRLEGCATVEIYRNAVAMIPDKGLVNADDERVATLKKVLKRACDQEGVELVPEAKWRVGEESHLVAENEALNAILMPLALQQAGNKKLQFFLDKSDTGKVEAAGTGAYTAVQSLDYLFFRFPEDFGKFASGLASYNKNIEKHLEVLGKIEKDLDKTNQIQDETLKTLSKLQKTMKPPTPRKEKAARPPSEFYR